MIGAIGAEELGYLQSSGIRATIVDSCPNKIGVMSNSIKTDSITLHTMNMDVASADVVKMMTDIIFTHQSASKVLLISWLQILRNMRCRVFLNSLMYKKSMDVGNLIWTGNFKKSQERISLLEYHVEPNSRVTSMFARFIGVVSQTLMPSAEEYFRGIWKMLIYDLYQYPRATHFTLCHPLMQNRVVYVPSKNLLSEWTSARDGAVVDDAFFNVVKNIFEELGDLVKFRMTSILKFYGVTASFKLSFTVEEVKKLVIGEERYGTAEQGFNNFDNLPCFRNILPQRSVTRLLELHQRKETDIILESQECNPNPKKRKQETIPCK